MYNMQLCIVLSLSCQMYSQSIIVWTPSLGAFSFALKLLLFTHAKKLSTDFALFPWSPCVNLSFPCQPRLHFSDISVPSICSVPIITIGTPATMSLGALWCNRICRWMSVEKRPWHLCLSHFYPPSLSYIFLPFWSLNEPQRQCPQRTEPQKTLLRKDRTSKDTPPKGSNRKRHASKRIEPQRHASKRIEPQKTRLWKDRTAKDDASNRIEPQKTVPPQKEPFRR
jgi:hypothetical protein